jgi:multiple sugar transport system substrate-binding protein
VRLRTLTVALALVATVAAAAGCGSGGSGGGSDTVTWMSWETAQTNQALDASFARFASSSGLTLKREAAPNADYAQKLASLIMSKKVPDFFWCSNVQEQTLASQGLLYDWSGYLAKKQGLDPAKFSPGALESWRRGGKLYGVPTLANTYGFFYNKALFAKAGVTDPAAGWSYDQMFAAAAALTGKNGAKQGLVTQWTLLTSPFGMAQYSVSAGGKPLASSAVDVKKMTVDPKLTEVARRYNTAIKTGQISPAEADNGNATSAFANGSIPLLFGGQWLAQTMVGQKLSFDWGYAPMPQVTTNVQPTEANGVCSPATLRNPDQVWKAVSYMETTGFNDTMKKVPVAPIAYLPGSDGYFQALQGQGTGPASVAATVRYELSAPTKVQTGFLDSWATKAANVVTAEWNPAIDGKKDLTGGISTTTKDINALIANGS